MYMQTYLEEATAALQNRRLTLTVIIPCYNEVNTVEKVLSRVEAVGLADEIIIVDDGSTDGTRDVLKRIEDEGRPNLRFFYHSHNQGKGAALLTGFHQATSDVFLIQDADFEYDPREYPTLLTPHRGRNCQGGVRVTLPRRPPQGDEFLEYGCQSQPDSGHKYPL